MRGVILGLMTMVGAAGAAPVLAQGLPGYDRMEVASPHRAWKVQASVWYPAGTRTYVGNVGDNPIFHGERVLMGPKVAGGKHPLVLFSHGSGGNMDNMGWLLSGLAQRGAMVLAVNHPGSTSGDSSPRRSMELGARAQDLSAALDVLLAEPAFADHVDLDRVTSLGFSLGGATALNLGGVRFDATRYAPYCAQDAARADCAFFDKGGVDFARLPEGFSADGRDGRVTAVAAIDPGFTWVATEDSMAAMDLPVMLVNLGEDARLGASDVGPGGSGFAARLARVDYREFAPASHFTALPECQEDAAALLEEEGEDPICDDPLGADRAVVHAQVIEALAAFLGLEASGH
ncbi:alpha/beta hydrolase family protein [Sagittula sp. S175]|uniref:alpha/beta hydrolase family protein n=1 Tax=Sagittula sp. S175 TaxID=3415129 RepID=UPI003C7B1AE7